MGINIVWFKRDLRVHDHAALTLAAAQAEVLPLVIIEPQLWQQPDMSARQYEFMLECLHELKDALAQRGGQLLIKVGEAVEVLEALRQRYVVTGLYSHQETWNLWTYERDKQVAAWADQQQIQWYQPVQNGVIRRLEDRDGWAKKWYDLMQQAQIAAPEQLQTPDIASDSLPDINALRLQPDHCIQRQQGGRREGLKLLRSFLYERGEHYSKAMSSPVSAFDACSRLSAHIAFGTLSVREVFQTTQVRQAEIKQMPRGTKGQWPRAMRSFMGRLRWHCHFIQKLEDEPRAEFENLHSAYNGLRSGEFNQAYLHAWQRGRTGYPMIDACMHALIATGWLNFRMRAMLMSFASYHLWLPWQVTAPYLARLFTDYEPGIHYSQVQMQSGTTGINSIRIYNPIKQGIDQDPDGVFIKHWLPELTAVSTQAIHTPWIEAENMGDYPLPIVYEKEARKAAASQLYPLRKKPEHKAEAQTIVKKHGSRKRSNHKGSKRSEKQSKTAVKASKQPSEQQPQQQSFWS